MAEINNTQPLVSIGVPAYNGGKYLEECLDSILAQDYQNWECVISNNASTDNTAEVALAYAERDPRIKVFHTESLLPITENWNYCFSCASKEATYFKLLPADDWIYPAFLSSMVEVMEAEKEAAICSSFRLVDTILRSEGLDVYAGNRFDGKEMLIRQLKQELNLTSSINAVLYRMDALKALSYYPVIFQDEAFHQDTFLSYELLEKHDLAFVFQVLSYTRRHNESVTSTVTSRLNTRLYFKEYALHRYMDLHPSLKEAYAKIRRQYAYFFLKAKIRRSKKALEWHRKRLQRPFGFNEYLQALLKRSVKRSV